MHRWATTLGFDHLPIGPYLRTKPSVPLRSLASATLRGVGRDAAYVVQQLLRGPNRRDLLLHSPIRLE